MKAPKKAQVFPPPLEEGEPEEQIAVEPQSGPGAGGSSKTDGSPEGSGGTAAAAVNPRAEATAA